MSITRIINITDVLLNEYHAFTDCKGVSTEQVDTTKLKKLLGQSRRDNEIISNIVEYKYDILAYWIKNSNKNLNEVFNHFNLIPEKHPVKQINIEKWIVINEFLPYEKCTMWTTCTGEKILLEDLTEEHILNIVKYFISRRRFLNLNLKMIEYFDQRLTKYKISRSFPFIEALNSEWNIEALNSVKSLRRSAFTNNNNKFNIYDRKKI